MNLEVVKGTASGLRTAVEVSGNRDGVSTLHHALFKIGGVTVTLASGSPPPISEGDRLVVAGRMKGRLLQADAYLDVTVGVRGDAGMLYSLVCGVCFLLMFVAAVVGIILYRLPADDAWLQIVMQVMIGAIGLSGGGYGLYCLRRWRRIREAVRLVTGG